MSTDLSPAAIEQLAIDTFERLRAVRERAGLASFENRDYDLEIVAGQTRAGEGGIAMTLRYLVFEDSSIRDVKEQEIWVVPGEADDARLVPYFESMVRVLERLAREAPDRLEMIMPYDVVPWRGFRDPDCQTAEQFAAFAGRPEPALATLFDELVISEPLARNEALERAIDDDPENVDAYLVYADWLTEQGDPRGELIACSAPKASDEAKRRSAGVLARNETYFAGPFLSSDRLAEYVQVGFRLGYFDQIRIALDYELFQEMPDFASRTLAALMQMESSRFLRGLTLGCIDYEGDCNFEKLYPILEQAGPRPSFVDLFIGDTNAEEQEISWTNAGDLGRLTRLYRNLRSLRVHAGGMALTGALDLPKLETLSLETGGLAAENVREVAARTFPALTSLELWFGSSGYGATATVDDIAPILAGERLPKVTRLGLCNCEWTDALVEPLARSQILPRVRELDLSRGILTDTGAAALLAHKAAFAGLAKLDVSENYVSDAGLASLAGLGCEIVSSMQRYDDGDRYVSVGE